MTRSRNLSARAPIYGALRAAGGPMTAYQILDAVRDHGITAPPTVYRALNRLVDEGLAHRVESLNAYVACAHSHHGEGAAAVFAICENCGMVSEIEADAAVAGLRAAAAETMFRVDRMTVELRGLCSDCGEGAEPGRDRDGHHDHAGHDHD
ncbi:MAG: Fur family transcriptional regulator [Bauldia sp.]